MSRPVWPRETGASLLVAFLVFTASCAVGDSGPPQTTPSTTMTSPSTSPPVSPRGEAPAPSREPAPGPTISATPTTASTSARPPTPGRTPLQPSASPSPSRTTAPLIVIDPGHSGRYGRRIDPATGLRDIDYPNYPEIYEMFDVSTCLARALRADGYRVLLTKGSALSRVGHRERAEIANRNDADLAISVHDDHGQSARFQATYSQRGVPDSRGRYQPMYRGRGRDRTVFARAAVARESDAAARTIAKARSKVLGRHVAVTTNSFDGRAPLEPGNLALVQLFATVPWVYNEAGARTGGSTSRAMSIASERNYAAGLLAGIEAAAPRAGSGSGSGSSARGLTACLRRQVEPEPGRFTRPQKYRPADL